MKIAALFASIPLMAGALVAQSASDGRLPGEGGQGVKVLLLPPSPQTHEPLRYVLSEPAYVAAFIVYPGAGVRLLTPLINAPERLHRGGYNSDQLIGLSFDDDIYHAVLGPTIYGPGYLYVIASRHPLDVARYVHKPTMLAAAIGQRESRSFYTDVQFDALLNNAISLGDDTSWDADSYILWPGSGASTALAADAENVQYMYLQCADGSSRIVPTNYPFMTCPGQPHVRVNDVVTPRVQQSASATTSAKASATVSRSTASAQVARVTSVAAAPPTVLPTIIGARISDADRRAAIQQEAASQRIMFTAANGGEQAAQQPVGGGTVTQLEVVRVPGGARESTRDRDGIQDPYSAQQREELRRNGMNSGANGSPGLAPDPRLSPNPVLAPAPRLTPMTTMPAAPQPERQQREFRNEQPSRPAAMPRAEQPQMTQPAPAAAPSPQGASESSAGREGGRARPTPPTA